jgi:hypothetical protein
MSSEVTRKGSSKREAGWLPRFFENQLKQIER